MTNHSAVTACIVAASLALSLPARADNDFAMEPVRIEDGGADGGGPVIIGATPVTDPNRWRSTYMFKSPTNGPCTATAVGPQVILTAAHCLGKQVARGTLKAPGRPNSIEVTCTRHHKYNSASADARSFDFALCFATTLLPATLFERISTSLVDIRDGTKVILLGYGCTTPGGGDRMFGALYEGSSTIARVPSSQRRYIETSGDAAICFGDSGGGAFLEWPQRRRALIGVNSRGDINTQSLISTTATVEFVDWVETWKANQATRTICGFDKIVGCHQ